MDDDQSPCTVMNDSRVISSFVPLLKIFSNFYLIDSHYMLLGPVGSQDWEHFRQCSKGVEVFELGAEDEIKQSVSTFIQLLSKLNGEPLLPALKTLRVNNIISSLNYAPFLFSASTEEVRLNVKSISPDNASGSTAGPAASPGDLPTPLPSPTSPSSSSHPDILGAFLQVVANQAPGIMRLYVNYPTPMTIASLERINRLANIRVLDIGRLAGIERTREIFNSLAQMERLEVLRLVVIEVASTFRRWSALLSCGGSVGMSRLTELDIKGPSQVVSEFLDHLDAPTLRALCWESTCWLHGGLRGQIGKKKKGKASGAEGELKFCTETCAESCLVPHKGELTTRPTWETSLEELSIISCPQTFYDLSPISELKALKHLDIRGSISSLGGLLGAPFWTRLESLHAASDTEGLTLDQLRDIAKRSPRLGRMAAHVDVKEVSDEVLNELEPLDHPLKELTIIDRIQGGHDRASEGAYSPQHAAGAARALHLLFPNLEQMRCTSNRSVYWETVGEMMKLSRLAIWDAKRRQSIG